MRLSSHDVAIESSELDLAGSDIGLAAYI